MQVQDKRAPSVLCKFLIIKSLHNTEGGAFE
jgi:hypothetical protein